MLKQTQNEFLQSVVKETQSDEAFVGNSRKPPDKGSSMSVLSGLQVRGRAPASLGRGRMEATIGNLGQKTSRRSQVAQERKPPFLQWEDATLCEQPMCLIRVTGRSVYRALREVTLKWTQWAALSRGEWVPQRYIPTQPSEPVGAVIWKRKLYQCH